MPRFCHSCGAALAEQGPFCSACGTPFEPSVAPTKSDNHSAAVSATLDADRRLRVRLGLAAATLGVFLIGIIVMFASRSSPPDGSAAPTSTVSKNEVKPSPAPLEDSTSAQHETASPAVVLQDRSEDHELREDGRVYSVALIDATPEIPPGAKLLAQGRVQSFDYADAVGSRRYAIIEDEQQSGRTLMCAMRGEEGVEAFSLYHVGEVVAVSGEYLDTAGYDGWPRVALTNCHVAGPQDNVVRPLEIAHAERPASPESKNVSPTTTPESIEEPLSFDDALDKCTHIVRQRFPKLSVWPGLEDSSRRLYQQNDKRLLLYLEFDPGMGIEEGSGVATCDVRTSRVILKSLQLGITRYDYNDDGSVAQKSGWTGWQNGMQPIDNRIPQSTPSESIPTQQSLQNSGPDGIAGSIFRQRHGSSTAVLEAGARVLIHVVSMSRQPDGDFTFRGTLLQPLALVGAAPLDQGTELAGSGTVNVGHVTVSVTGFTVRGENYRLQAGSGANKRAGSGPAIELDPGKVLEMWFASASVYEKNE